MKRLSFLFILMCTILPVLLFSQTPLQIQPQKPKAGEKISITYNTTGTELFGVTDPEGYVYLMEGTLPLVKEIKLLKKGNIYTGEFTTNDTTKAVLLVFSRDEKRDNNSDKGYYSMLYTATGKPVGGAMTAMSQAYNSYSGILGLKRNTDAALTWSRQAILADPTIKDKKPLAFVDLLYPSKEEADLESIRKALNTIVSAPGSSEADLSAAKMHYEIKLRDKSRSAEVDSVIKARYPSGAWVRNAIRDQIYKEKDPAKQAELFSELKKTINTNIEEEQKLLASVSYPIATNYAKAGNMDKAKEFAANIPDKENLANLYNSIAWKETGGSVDGKPGNLEAGKELSAKSLRLIRETKKEMKNKPPYRTGAQYLKSLDNTYNMYADTYALLLYHSKEYQKAYDIQKKAVESTKGLNVSMNEAFAAYTEKVMNPEITMSTIENFIRDGRYSPKMKEQLKRIYLAQNKTQESWNVYITALEAYSLEKKRQELAKKMINESAPSFVLKDMQGNEVTLASLKGKVVVVDFWATWCGPCKASFPGMKMAVEKYKEDKNVKFVFIDTWENGEKDIVRKNVAEFIEKNAYPFHVLMDMDSKTVESFNVDGIPTKFVIDTNNRIRFKSVGFAGSSEGLVSELGMMIEMAGTGDASGSQKKSF